MSKTIKISAKCDDRFFATLRNDGEHAGEIEGDIPHGFSLGGGDYVRFELDLETGKIVGFDSAAALEAFEEYAR